MPLPPGAPPPLLLQRGLAVVTATALPLRRALRNGSTTQVVVDGGGGGGGGLDGGAVAAVVLSVLAALALGGLAYLILRARGRDIDTIIYFRAASQTNRDGDEYWVVFAGHHAPHIETDKFMRAAYPRARRLYWDVLSGGPQTHVVLDQAFCAEFNEAAALANEKHHDDEIPACFLPLDLGEMPNNDPAALFVRRAQAFRARYKGEADAGAGEAGSESGLAAVAPSSQVKRPTGGGGRHGNLKPLVIETGGPLAHQLGLVVGKDQEWYCTQVRQGGYGAESLTQVPTSVPVDDDGDADADANAAADSATETQGDDGRDKPRRMSSSRRSSKKQRRMSSRQLIAQASETTTGGLTAAAEIELPVTAEPSFSVHTDNSTGRRYSYNSKSGLSEWLDGEKEGALDGGNNTEEQECKQKVMQPDEVPAEGAGNGEEKVTVHRDDSTGRRYSYNAKSGEALWLEDSEDDEDTSEPAEAEAAAEAATTSTTTAMAGSETSTQQERPPSATLFYEVTQPNGEDPYFMNSVTDEVVWDLPEGADCVPFESEQ